MCLCVSPGVRAQSFHPLWLDRSDLKHTRNLPCGGDESLFEWSIFWSDGADGESVPKSDALEVYDFLIDCEAPSGEGTKFYKKHIAFSGLALYPNFAFV